MKRLCVDAGFLIGLYGESNGRHEHARNCFVEYFENTQNRLVVPWPILYETVSTHMVRASNRKGMEEFRRHWVTLKSQQRLDFIYDTDFRQVAFEECFSELERTPRSYRPLSLADRVIRKILSETNYKIDAFITFNIGDFQDICARHRIEIIP